MLSLAYRDLGIMDCEYVATGETEEELWGEGQILLNLYLPLQVYLLKRIQKIIYN
jgi:hypothetical protein